MLNNGDWKGREACDHLLQIRLGKLDYEELLLLSVHSLLENRVVPDQKALPLWVVLVVGDHLVDSLEHLVFALYR